MLLAVFMSFFLGIILAFSFEYMDQTIKSVRDLEHSLRIPVFGSIPKIRNRKHMIVNTQNIKKLPKRYVRAFGNLADKLLLMASGKSFQTVLVTATNIYDGMTVIVSNLGINLAGHTARNILIVDANYRHPSLHKVFNLPLGPGLVDVLVGQMNLGEVIRNIQPRLSVLTAGQTNLNPIMFLDSPKLSEVMKDLKNRFDLILIDCAHLKSYQDGYMIASCVDKVLFVVCENQTRRQSASRAIATLKECHASILGTILNKRTLPTPTFVYERI